MCALRGAAPTVWAYCLVLFLHMCVFTSLLLLYVLKLNLSFCFPPPYSSDHCYVFTSPRM